MTPEERLRFRAAQRVRRPGEFKRIYGGGRRFGNELFTATVQPNGLKLARLGMAVAVRTLGGAVGRNRIRRLIRETFRLNQRTLNAVDIVVGVRPRVRIADDAARVRALDHLWSTVAAACASLSASSSAPISSR